ncbi:unnamed protein product [Rotaria magnacalcarata]|nr:unnamed protein product [Rotaria magnacalcarata]
MIGAQTRIVSINDSLPSVGIAQPRPHANAMNSRQLPSLPMNIRQLPLLPSSLRPSPNVDSSNSTKLYFNIEDTENDDEVLTTKLARPGELFYYQTSTSSSSTSSASNSNNSSSENFDNENNGEPFENRNQQVEGEEDDEDQISPCEYEA